MDDHNKKDNGDIGTWQKLKEVSKKGYEVVSEAGKIITDAASESIDNANKHYQESEAKKKVDEYFQAYMESRIKEYVDAAYEKSVDTIDTVSGAKMLEEVRGRLDKQNLYNNILATKLAEALKRISELENDITKLREGK